MTNEQENQGGGNNGPGGGGHEHDVQVHVRSLKTNERTHFDVPETATVADVWEIAVDTDHLNEPRAEGDTLRCADGTDLTNRLSSTLQQLHDEHVCENRQFEIRGASGGA